MPRHVGRGADQEPEAGVETSLELGDRERPQPRRGQLQREGDAVEAPAHVADAPEVVVGRLEPRPGQRGAVEEQLHRLGVEAERVVVGHGERVDDVDRLPDEAERLAAGGHHAHRPSGLEDLLGEEGGLAEDVLAVVQHQQHLRAAEAVADGVGQQAGLLLLDAERGGDRCGHAVGRGGVGGADVGEADQPDAVGVMAHASRRPLRRRAGSCRSRPGRPA